MAIYMHNTRVTLIDQPPISARGLWDVLARLLKEHDLQLEQIGTNHWQIIPAMDDSTPE